MYFMRSAANPGTLKSSGENLEVDLSLRVEYYDSLRRGLGVYGPASNCSTKDS